MSEMREMTLQRIARVTGGRLHIAAGKEALTRRPLQNIVTDSRQAGPGSLFAAIVGERVDGHRFIPQVFEKGAWGVISEQELTDPAGSWIKVDSTLEALKAIARDYLSVLDIPVVGITGSVGKTSTKETVAAVLAQKFNVLKTAGNFNNELGLPLTIFRLRDEHQIAVLEMGISHFGEMHRLADIARPDIAVITNIGQCHLEFLGDRDGVFKAKTEIFAHMKKDGRVILNGNDDKLTAVKEVNGHAPVFFGIPSAGNVCQSGPDESGCAQTPSFGVWADQIRPAGLKGISCTIHYSRSIDTIEAVKRRYADSGAGCPEQTGEEAAPAGEETFSVLIPVPGEHMVMNAAAATAVGLSCGLTGQQIKAGIESLQPVSGRFHIIENGRYTIIDDCYNANPMSMKASLSVLKDADTRKVAVLGDMFELGPEEMSLHADVGRYAAGVTLDELIAIGPRSRAIAQEASKNENLRTVHYDTLDAFMEDLNAPGQSLIRDGDTVLIKASHAMNFARIVEKLEKCT